MKFINESQGDWTAWRAGHLAVHLSPKRLLISIAPDRHFDGDAIKINYGQSTISQFNSKKDMTGFFITDLLKMFKAHCRVRISKDMVINVAEAMGTAYNFSAYVMDGQLGEMYEGEFVDIEKLESRRKHYGDVIPLL